MQTLWQDVSYGLRGIRNRPGFAFLAILTLALGMGATTTIFSAIQNILLDPFPYRDASRVVGIQVHDNTTGRLSGHRFYNTLEYLEIESQNHSFEEVIGGIGDPVLYDNGEGMEQLIGGFVTANTFRFLVCRHCSDAVLLRRTATQTPSRCS